MQHYYILGSHLAVLEARSLYSTVAFVASSARSEHTVGYVRSVSEQQLRSHRAWAAVEVGHRYAAEAHMDLLAVSSKGTVVKLLAELGNAECYLGHTCEL